MRLKITAIYLVLACLAGLIGWRQGVAGPAQATDAANPIIVTTTNDSMDGDDGLCSLREALYNANHNDQYSAEPGECPPGSAAATDLILLESGETYLLTLDGSGDDAGSLKALASSAADVDLRIETVGNDLPAVIHMTVSGQRVLEIHDAVVEINDLILSGGNIDGPGGGIMNQGVLTLTNSLLQNNSARNGGGLYNQGQVVLRNSQIISSTAVVNGGGVVNRGGGLLLIENSQIVANSAGQNGGGLYHLDDESELTIAGSVIMSNTAAAEGGGLHTLAAATITGSSFTQNEAPQSVGGAIFNNAASLTLQRVSFTDNQALSGGALYNANGVVNGANGTFAGNEALLAHGGALYNSGPAAEVYFQGTAFQANEAAAGHGGAFYHSGQTLILNDVILRHNLAQQGAALYLAVGAASLSQTSIVHNEASEMGGGIFLQSGLTLGNVTLGDNSAAGSGDNLYITESGTVTAGNITLVAGGAGQNLFSLGELTLQNSIISGGGASCHLPDEPIISLGHNLTNDDSCVGLDHAADLSAANLLLAPLDNYYSEQFTYALLPDSPALNAADADACAAAPVNGLDQRGLPRPYGPACDIGAHEEQLPLRTYLPLIVAP